MKNNETGWIDCNTFQYIYRPENEEFEVDEEEKGIFSLSLEQRLENCKKGGEIMGQRTKELGIGIHAQTPEERRELAKKAAVAAYNKCIENYRGYSDANIESLCGHLRK